MKNIKEMSFEELKTEIKYIASLLDDQPIHASYLADLAEELAARVAAEML